MKALEHAQKSPEPKKDDPSIASKDLKEAVGSSPEQPPKKKSKQFDSQTFPGKFFSIHFTQVESVSFAYPSDLPDPSLED